MPGIIDWKLQLYTKRVFEFLTIDIDKIKQDILSAIEECFIDRANGVDYDKDRNRMKDTIHKLELRIVHTESFFFPCTFTSIFNNIIAFVCCHSIFSSFIFSKSSSTFTTHFSTINILTYQLRIEKLTDMRADGEITKEEFISRREKAKEEILELENKLMEMPNTPNCFRGNASSYSIVNSCNNTAFELSIL